MLPRTRILEPLREAIIFLLAAETPPAAAVEEEEAAKSSFIVVGSRRGPLNAGATAPAVEREGVQAGVQEEHTQAYAGTRSGRARKYTQAHASKHASDEQDLAFTRM